MFMRYSCKFTKPDIVNSNLQVIKLKTKITYMNTYLLKFNGTAENSLLIIHIEKWSLIETVYRARKQGNSHTIGFQCK